MYSFLKSKQIILFICLLTLSASHQSVEAKTAHKSRQSRLYLVPPPPPYIPSMLPELTYSRGIYGQGYDSNSKVARQGPIDQINI